MHVCMCVDIRMYLSVRTHVSKMIHSKSSRTVRTEGRIEPVLVLKDRPNCTEATLLGVTAHVQHAKHNLKAWLKYFT